MRSVIKSILASCVLACASTVFAGTSVLGVEMGVTTASQFRQDMAKKGNVEGAGVNKYTNGDMYRVDGSAYEIDGLKTVLFIFDDQKKLAGVVMEMDKEAFDDVFQIMSKKYKIVSQQRPFVGNKFVRFKTADASVEVSAPHLDFTMEVRYIRDDLERKYTAQNNAEAAAKKKAQASNF